MTYQYFLKGGEIMKVTETNEFRLMVAEMLLEKVQDDLCFLESEFGEEEVSPVQDTVANVILLIRDCR